VRAKSKHFFVFPQGEFCEIAALCTGRICALHGAVVVLCAGRFCRERNKKPTAKEPSAMQTKGLQVVCVLFGDFSPILRVAGVAAQRIEVFRNHPLAPHGAIFLFCSLSHWFG
jgi:hypothetical protein